ncbi:transposase [Actinomadura harenae]|uniref:transposase n=1 Tax=Actinomadura harenae TaxID=2483351 RepID=UPI0018F4C15E
MALTVDGTHDILELWVGDGGEDAKYWLHVLTELKNLGMADTCTVVCDGCRAARRPPGTGNATRCFAGKQPASPKR